MMLVIAVVPMVMLVAVFGALFTAVAPCFTAVVIVFAETHPGKLSLLSGLIAFAGFGWAVCLASGVV